MSIKKEDVGSAIGIITAVIGLIRLIFDKDNPKRKPEKDCDCGNHGKKV
jgi:hypothetical protein